MLYSFLVGGEYPGSKSMAQSYGQCGGRDCALSLVKTSFRSWYSQGRVLPRSISSCGSWGIEVPVETVKQRQSEWAILTPASDRYCGPVRLCCLNQGRPSTTGDSGEDITSGYQREFNVKRTVM